MATNALLTVNGLAKTYITEEIFKDVAFQIASWVTVMHHGRIVSDGPPDRVRADPVVLGIYLGATEERAPIPAEGSA